MARRGGEERRVSGEERGEMSRGDERCGGQGWRGEARGEERREMGRGKECGG